MISKVIVEERPNSVWFLVLLRLYLAVQMSKLVYESCCLFQFLWVFEMSITQICNNNLLLLSVAYQVQREPWGWMGPLRPCSPNSRSDPDASPVILYIKSCRYHLHYIWTCYHFSPRPLPIPRLKPRPSHSNYCNSLPTDFSASTFVPSIVCSPHSSQSDSLKS